MGDEAVNLRIATKILRLENSARCGKAVYSHAQLRRAVVVKERYIQRLDATGKPRFFGDDWRAEQAARLVRRRDRILADIN